MSKQHSACEGLEGMGNLGSADVLAHMYMGLRTLNVNTRTGIPIAQESVVHAFLA